MSASRAGQLYSPARRNATGICSKATAPFTEYAERSIQIAYSAADMANTGHPG